MLILTKIFPRNQTLLYVKTPNKKLPTKDPFLLKNQLLILFFFFSIANASASECRDFYQEWEYTYFHEICNEQGKLEKREEFFADTHKLSSEEWFDSQKRIIKKINYSSQGEKRLTLFTYTTTTLIQTNYQKDSDQIESKREYLLSNKREIREWKYKDNQLKWIDDSSHHEPKQILKRRFEDTGISYHYTYRPQSKYGNEIESYQVIDAQGKLINQYRSSFNGDIESIIQKQFRGEEQERKLEIFRNTSRLPVAIIDSGFDLYHPEISFRLHNSQIEEWGNIDRDGNGLKGDTFGWRYDDPEKQGPNIQEKVIMVSTKPIPLSHGTHVASIALKDQDRAGLLGFATQDVSQPQFLQLVSHQLKSKNIRLANMSWGFGEAGTPFTPDQASYTALKNLIKTNPQTLFFVAAGNNAWDIDNGPKTFPAAYEDPNLLVVGALNEDDYQWSNDHNLRVAEFKNQMGSNYGFQSVDVFAPGKEVNGAKLAGDKVRMSGTSMASPYALNSTISTFLANPTLNTLELKEILMKSVAYIKKDLPCVSRGLVHPQRAQWVAEQLSTYPTMGIDEAVFLARKQKDLFLTGEIEKNREEILAIWEEVEISLEK